MKVFGFRSLSDVKLGRQGETIDFLDFLYVTRHPTAALGRIGRCPPESAVLVDLITESEYYGAGVTLIYSTKTRVPYCIISQHADAKGKASSTHRNRNKAIKAITAS